jgi:hypothetical protein
MYQIMLKRKTQMKVTCAVHLRTGSSWNIERTAVCLQHVLLVDRVGDRAERGKWYYSDF